MTVLAYNKLTSNGPRVPSIAIIGMEGSGKTVLTTTLAKRLSTIDTRGIFLNPQGVKTLKYVESVWQTLQSGDWPPSTPPGELSELKWKFQIVGEMECDVRIVDAAGQDLRLLFEDEQIHSDETLPQHLQTLAEYCRSADIILFMINLRDFLGQGNTAQRTANEAAIKSAMDHFGSEGRVRGLCLILSQADLYRDLADQRGGWLELAAEAVPYVFSAHVRARHIAVHPVAAVSDTKVVVDPDGTPRRVPTVGFRSEGLDELVAWLTEQIRDIKRRLDEESASIQLDEQVTRPQTARMRETVLWSTIIVAVAFVLGLSIILVYVSGSSNSGAAKSGPTAPIARLERSQYYIDGFWKDIVVTHGTVHNDGAHGTIRVHSWVTENGQQIASNYKDYSLAQGQSIDYQIARNIGKRFDRNKHKVHTVADVP